MTARLWKNFSLNASIAPSHNDNDATCREAHGYALRVHMYVYANVDRVLYCRHLIPKDA